MLESIENSEQLYRHENLLKQLIGKKIIDIAQGYSFIEISLDDGSTWVIESTTGKSTKHQERVDVNIYKEEK